MRSKQVISGIYKITNLLSNKAYIGQSKDIMRRYKQHMSGKKSAINSAIKKYGKENFTLEILFEVKSFFMIENIDTLEKMYIRIHN